MAHVDLKNIRLVDLVLSMRYIDSSTMSGTSRIPVPEMHATAVCFTTLGEARLDVELTEQEQHDFMAFSQRIAARITQDLSIQP